MYIGWPTNVNKIIRDSTTVTVGNGAAVQDTIEAGGQKKSRLVSANPPDKFSVHMDFSFSDESRDENGLTEIERFYSWYKWQHRYGVNPFKFPAILINSNRQKGYSQEERGYLAEQKNNKENPRDRYTADDIPDYEYYVITSMSEGAKSGTDLSVSMTWETYATGVLTIPEDESAIDHISPMDGFVDVTLTLTPLSEPTSDTWEVFVDNEKINIISYLFDGDVTVRLFFEKFADGNRHTLRIGDYEEFFTGDNA